MRNRRTTTPTTLAPTSISSNEDYEYIPLDAGDAKDQVTAAHGRIDDINDGTILAALTSVLCEMLHTCGETVDDDFIERVRATYGAVVLADALRKTLEDASVADIPMPTTTVQ